jgi:hypothetical protein
MALYEFLIDCKNIAIQNGFFAEIARLSEVIACLSIEEAGKEVKK